MIMKEEVNVKQLIGIFNDMRKRQAFIGGSHDLTFPSHNDIYIQLLGVIAHLAMKQNESKGIYMAEQIGRDELIRTLQNMKKRGSLLTGKKVNQLDVYNQIIGVIISVALETENDKPSKRS